MSAAAEWDVRISVGLIVDEPLGTELVGIGVQLRVAVDALGVDEDERSRPITHSPIGNGSST